MGTNYASKQSFKNFKLTRFYNIGLFLSGLIFVHWQVERNIELKEGQTLLDIGCGTGLLLSSIVKKYGSRVNLLGIDIDAEKIEAARKKLARLAGEETVRLKIASADDLPSINDSFDLIISTLTAHHLAPEIKTKMIGECGRTLKPGGKLYIADFGKPVNFIGTFLAFFSKSHGYTKDNMELIEKNLEKNGLKILSKSYQFGFIEHLIMEKIK